PATMPDRSCRDSSVSTIAAVGPWKFPPRITRGRDRPRFRTIQPQRENRLRIQLLLDDTSIVVFPFLDGAPMGPGEERSTVRPGPGGRCSVSPFRGPPQCVVFSGVSQGKLKKW